MNYKSEGNPYKLWIPKDSDFVKNTDWLWNHYPPNTRFHSVIVTAPNVLNPEVIGEYIYIIYSTYLKKVMSLIMI